MQHTDITKFPAIDLTNHGALSALFPNESTAALPGAAAKTIKAIFSGLEPQQDPHPTALVLGWDAVLPTMDVLSVDPRFLKDGETKQQLAVGIRDMILKRRALEQETYAVAFINAAWFKSVRTSELHILQGCIRNGLSGEPEKREVMLVDTIWQDGQRIILSEIQRSQTGAPTLKEPWRDVSAGAVAVRNRFWHTIAPALCAPSYADAVLAAFEGEGDLKGGGL